MFGVLAKAPRNACSKAVLVAVDAARFPYVDGRGCDESDGGNGSDDADGYTPNGVKGDAMDRALRVEECGNRCSDAFGFFLFSFLNYFFLYYYFFFSSFLFLLYFIFQ